MWMRGLTNMIKFDPFVPDFGFSVYGTSASAVGKVDQVVERDLYGVQYRMAGRDASGAQD